MLQHTPDVHRAFAALVEQIAPGGRIAVDLYPRLAANVLWPKDRLRPLTRRLPAERLFSLVSRMVNGLWPVSLALGPRAGRGRKLRHALPIANYEGLLPLDSRQLKEWAVLDTFDMLAPAHDHPQTVKTVTRWFEEARLADAEVFRDGLVVGRGRQRPAGSRLMRLAVVNLTSGGFSGGLSQYLSRLVPLLANDPRVLCAQRVRAGTRRDRNGSGDRRADVATASGT